MEDQTFITKKPHAVVVVSPGIGHLTPTTELVKRLVTYHNFEVTLFAIVADSSSVQSQILSSACSIPNNNFLHVQVIELDVSDQLPPVTDLVVKLIVTMANAVPLVRSTISAMKIRPDILITDLFGMDYCNMADEFNMSKYVFMTTSAYFLALTVYLPVFENEVSKDELERLECIQVPGCRHVTRIESKESFDRDDGPYIWIIDTAKKIAMCDGIIVNSWHELEPKAIRSLNDKLQVGKGINGNVYPIGPLVKKSTTVCNEHVEDAPYEINEVFKWMDDQPHQSILYISFGSGGSLTHEQIQELAWGLEFSQQRFIWVLRPPLDKDASKFFFSVDICDDDTTPFDYLPAGFLTRTKHVGLVVPMWAPQTEILEHKSVGGFLTHCGWNSIIESVVNGVPMIAWPLYAEQELNATTLTDELKIGVRAWSTKEVKVIEREEIEKAIRKIMADKVSNVIRERVKKLQKGAVKAGDPSKGSSYNSLMEFTKLCIRKMK